MHVRNSVLATTLAAASMLFAFAAHAQDAAAIARGEYLVNRVAGCNDCHSPLTPTGQPVAGRELTGSPLPFTPSVPMPWAPVAPPIRGLPPGWTQVQLAGFLQNGVRPNGSHALPPMPAYRLTAADARAVSAYIGSLK